MASGIAGSNPVGYPMFKRLRKWLRRPPREIHLVSQLRIPKEWIDKLVEVHFWDHTQDGDALASMIARGRLAKIEGISILVLSWEEKDQKEIKDEIDRRNACSFWIFRSAITSITRLKREETKNVR